MTSQWPVRALWDATLLIGFRAMDESVPFLPWPHVVLEGPEDVGSEQRWRVQLEDGRLLAIGRLSPELARDESIRRRYVRDVQRRAAIGCMGVAPIVAMGPEPDPRDVASVPPWRARVEPSGERLDVWLTRAPLPLDEIAHVVAGLADALTELHEAGTLMRDVHPRNVVRGHDGRVMLTDFGLGRVDVLSSRTASSLLLEGSPYASPEQVMRTDVDLRSDLFGVGVILWQALTGGFPFGDGHALLREHHALPPIGALRADAPPALDVLLRRLLAERPEHRPEGAPEIAWVLRGGAAVFGSEGAPLACQHCGAPLRVGQRLCLACGRVGTRFVHDPSGRGWALELVTMSEDAGRLGALRATIDAVATNPARHRFLTDSLHLYTDEERATGVKLPARLFNDLDEDTARELHRRLREKGIDVRLLHPDRVAQQRKTALGTGLATTLLVAAGIGIGSAALASISGGLGFLATILLAARAQSFRTEQRRTPLHQLRRAPAALPASDPLVARLAALLGPDVPEDVKWQVGELALLVQRLVDRRAALPQLQRQELDLRSGPVPQLVELIERQVGELRAISQELGTLEEGAMVRALAAVDARGADPHARDEVMRGLDRLRALEDARARAFGRLLEAGRLLRRAVDLSLGVHDPAAEHERQVSLALASLGAALPPEGSTVG